MEYEGGFIRARDLHLVARQSGLREVSRAEFLEIVTRTGIDISGEPNLNELADAYRQASGREPLQYFVGRTVPSRPGKRRRPKLLATATPEYTVWLLNRRRSERLLRAFSNN